jgi:hypothetical protein
MSNVSEISLLVARYSNESVTLIELVLTVVVVPLITKFPATVSTPPTCKDPVTFAKPVTVVLPELSVLLTDTAPVNVAPARFAFKPS